MRANPPAEPPRKARPNRASDSGADARARGKEREREAGIRGEVPGTPSNEPGTPSNEPIPRAGSSQRHTAAQGWRHFLARVRYLFHSERWRVARNGILAGVAAGALTIAYRWTIATGTRFAENWYQIIRANPLHVVGFVAAACVLAVLVWLLLRWEPTASGSGIPQAKGFLLGTVPLRPLRTIIVRFLGGGAGGFFGLSLGREGPSIHIGASAAHLLSRPLHANEKEQKLLVTSGASAGLSAAFNAPVSGIVFGLEGLHKSFSPLVVVSAATGALAADAFSMATFGSTPILQFGNVTPMRFADLWILIPLGLITGVLGALVNQLLLASQSIAKLPGPTPLLIAFAAALPVGLFTPRALGGGEELIKWAEYTATGIGAVAVLLAVKTLFTAIAFGSGIPGGIFMPILAIGTLTGAGYALAVQQAGFPEGYQAALAVCGMAGLLASTVRTPLTSILLTAEMTGSLTHLLPVATVVILSVFVADALHVPPIYDALLKRMAPAS